MTEQTQQPIRLTAFSADSPYKICQAYAAGKISREQVIAELGSWDYKPRAKHDPIDGLPLSNSDGTWIEVEVAANVGLIDEEVYSQAQLLKNKLRNAI